jgi:hypothetical protein
MHLLGHEVANLFSIISSANIPDIVESTFKILLKIIKLWINTFFSKVVSEYLN